MFMVNKILSRTATLYVYHNICIKFPPKNSKYETFFSGRNIHDGKNILIWGNNNSIKNEYYLCHLRHSWH